MIEPIVRIRCPGCGALIEEFTTVYGVRVASTSIGPSVLVCDQCGAEVLTGRSEWSEKSSLAKFRFCMSRLLWFIPSAVAFGTIALIVWEVFRALVVNPRARVWQGVAVETWPVIVFTMTVGALAALTLWRCLGEIRDSNRRADAALVGGGSPEVTA